MKAKIIITSFFLLACHLLFAQYNGGSNDGSVQSIFHKQNNTDPNAFKGGSNDGFTNALLPKQNNTDANAFKGGSNDGSANALFTKQNSKDSLAFKGGNNDGFANAVFVQKNIKDSIAFKGGSNDGFAVSAFSRITITDATVFRGSNGRGETQVHIQKNICGQPGVNSIWNGSVSNAWNNPNNWNCGNMPTITSVVIIPSGLIRYPTVFISAEVKSLQLQAGSSVTVPSGIILKLNGQ
jgi:hypothetical protein